MVSAEPFALSVGAFHCSVAVPVLVAVLEELDVPVELLPEFDEVLAVEVLVVEVLDLLTLVPPELLLDVVVATAGPTLAVAI